MIFSEKKNIYFLKYLEVITRRVLSLRIFSFGNILFFFFYIFLKWLVFDKTDIKSFEYSIVLYLNGKNIHLQTRKKALKRWRSQQMQQKTWKISQKYRCKDWVEKYSKDWRWTFKCSRSIWTTNNLEKTELYWEAKQGNSLCWGCSGKINSWPIIESLWKDKKRWLFFK